jgi:diadenosine tetraphosphate (Ap4A) HIT family hydrolase
MDIDVLKFHDDIMNEYWLLLQLLTKLIYRFYDDDNGENTRIHICILNNMTGCIGNSHAHIHVIPRTNKVIKLGNYKFTDEFWGQSFNNNIRYKPTYQLLNLIRVKYIEILSSHEDLRKYIMRIDQIKVINFFSPGIPKNNYKQGCFQCTNLQNNNDDSITLFKTSNFRVVLRDDDQRVLGRSLIISINHFHPEEFKKHIDLVIEQNMIEIIVHETFKKCYNYKRGQFMRLGNLTPSCDVEHNHEHYAPSTDEVIVLEMENGEQIKIIDERWGKATNINTAEGYIKVKRSKDVINKIISDFRKNLIDITNLKDQIIVTLRNQTKDLSFTTDLEKVIEKIINELNINFI